MKTIKDIVKAFKGCSVNTVVDKHAHDKCVDKALKLLMKHGYKPHEATLLITLICTGFDAGMPESLVCDFIHDCGVVVHEF